MADNRRQGMEDLSYVRLLEEQLCAHRENVNYALATIVDTDQNTARTQGKMMVYENGAAVGTVGGGALETKVIHDACQAISTGRGGLFHYNMNSQAAREGLACGGSMSVFIEVYASRPVLVMCGAGHVGGCMMRLARLTGFQIYPGGRAALRAGCDRAGPDHRPSERAAGEGEDLLSVCVARPGRGQYAVRQGTVSSGWESALPGRAGWAVKEGHGNCPHMNGLCGWRAGIRSGGSAAAISKEEL